MEAGGGARTICFSSGDSASGIRGFVSRSASFSCSILAFSSRLRISVISFGSLVETQQHAKHLGEGTMGHTRISGAQPPCEWRARMV